MKTENRRLIGNSLVAAGGLIILGSIGVGAYAALEGYPGAGYLFAIPCSVGTAVAAVGMSKFLYDAPPFAEYRRE